MKPWMVALSIVAVAFLEVSMSVTAHPQDPLAVGAAAPDFTLPYATRDSIATAPYTLAAEIGKGPIVLAFYPADWSGGCTKEVCAFRDGFGDLATLGVRVWAISGDYVFSHFEWAKHHNLPFALLSDHDHAVAKRYATYNADKGYNVRSIYVIDTKGKIAYVNLQYSVADGKDFDALKTALAKIK